MKKTNLLKILLPSTLLSTIAFAIPLASCNKGTKQHIKLTSEASQKLDSDNNFQANFKFTLDGSGDIEIKSSLDSQLFKIEKTQTESSIDVNVKFLSFVNEDTNYSFSLEFVNKDWTEKIENLSVKAIAQSEQDVVNNINSILVESTAKPATMSELIALLNLHQINLESLPVSTNSCQWVWDCENNVVFVLKKDGFIKSAPAGYSLNQHKVNIWKMVGSDQTNNEEYVNKDAFSSTSQYSQYLRSNETFSKTLSFCSGIDTGSYTGFDLTFNKDETLTEEQPSAIINTKKSSLTVNSELNDIEHHGNLSTLTITKLPEQGTYTEFGTVDARVILNSGAIVAETGSSINDVVITSDDVVGVKVNEDAVVGTVIVTENVNKSASEFVDDLEAEIKTDTSKPKQDPTQTPRYAAGFGTKYSPYVISTKEQMFHCAEDVNGATLSVDNEMHFKLLNDIDLNNEVWTPIGSSAKPYYGIFDGNGYSISKITLSSEASEYKGFFSVTNGKKNSSYVSKDNIWDATTNTLKEEAIAEKNFSTVIKNLTLKGVNITNTESYTGCVVADAINTYISDVCVESGEITGHKRVGGIVASLEGSVANNCSTGAELVINSTGYNVGGICGTDTYTAAVGTVGGDAVVNCTNKANIVINSTLTSGYIGGIGGMFQNGKICAVVDSCKNYGNIILKANPSTNDCNDGCGIVGQCGDVYVVSNCINEGSITNTSNSAHIAGISAYGSPIIYNCLNKGNLTGSATQMAGIFADGVSTSVSSVTSLIGCNNTGTLTNNNVSGTTSDIAAGMSIVTLQDREFDNVHALNTAISSLISTAIVLNMKNVVVHDTTDEKLNIPYKMSTVTSDLKVCDEIEVTNASMANCLNLDVPDCIININDDCSNKYLCQDGKNCTITIGSTGKIGNVIIGNSGSKIINNGTVSGIIGIDGSAEYGENNGTCSKISLGSNSRIGKVDKHFINNGTILENASKINSHIICTCGGSVGDVIFDNYGTIQFDATSTTEYLGYVFCIYNSGTRTINCYANSKVITNSKHEYVFAAPDIYNYNVNYKTGAKFNDEEWSEQDFGPYIKIQAF